MLPSDRSTPPAVLALTGQIDHASAGRVRDQLTAALTTSPGTLIVDLTGSECCDTAALGQLAYAHRRAATNGTSIRLAVRRWFRGTAADWPRNCTAAATR